MFIYHASYVSRCTVSHFRRCITVAGAHSNAFGSASTTRHGSDRLDAALPEHAIVQSTAVLDDYFLTPEERAAYARGGAAQSSRAEAAKAATASDQDTARAKDNEANEALAADMVVGAVAAADAADAAADATMSTAARPAAAGMSADAEAHKRRAGTSQELAVMGLPVGQGTSGMTDDAQAASADR